MFEQSCKISEYFMELSASLAIFYTMIHLLGYSSCELNEQPPEMPYILVRSYASLFLGVINGV